MQTVGIVVGVGVLTGAGVVDVIDERLIRGGPIGYDAGSLSPEGAAATELIIVEDSARAEAVAVVLQFRGTCAHRSTGARVGRGAGRIGYGYADRRVDAVDVAYVVPIGAIGVQIEFGQGGARDAGCSSTLQADAAARTGGTNGGTCAIAALASPDSSDPAGIESEVDPASRTHLPAAV